MKTKEQIIAECSEMQVPLGSLINVGDGLALVRALDPMTGTVTDVERVNDIREGLPHGGTRDWQADRSEGGKS